jgi:hypothetical protein
MGPDYIERWIIARTELIVAARQMRQKGLTIMPIEIKGLKGKALKASSVFDRMNSAYDKLIETGSNHAADVEGLSPQIEAMQDDITFAVQTLGNSIGASEPPPPPPVPESPRATVPPPLQLQPEPQDPPQDPARAIAR